MLALVTLAVTISGYVHQLEALRLKLQVLLQEFPVGYMYASNGMWAFAEVKLLHACRARDRGEGEMIKQRAQQEAAEALRKEVATRAAARQANADTRLANDVLKVRMISERFNHTLTLQWTALIPARVHLLRV